MDPSAAILEALVKRGWSFRDPDEVKSLIRDTDSPESAESELLNADLRSIGAKSLPDPASLKKSSHLGGPKVLQLSSVRDIYRSTIDASFKNSQHHHRLLRFVLTDGISEVTAIEYVPLPSNFEEIVPGAKIRLENKIPVRNGILCLNPKVVIILGGIVPSLYEEWKISQKYSGFSRSSLKLSQNDNGVGPPPFEKLQVESGHHQVAQRLSSHGKVESSSRYTSHKNDSGQAGRSQDYQVVDKGQSSTDPKTDKVVVGTRADKAADDLKLGCSTDKSEDKPCGLEARPKEVSEAVPVQNQAAAQKLLQKMSQPAQGDRNFRGHRNRFKGKQEETQVFTLEEWERRKSNNLKPALSGYTHDICQDEELARQLQHQLDMEDLQERAKQSEAEQIKMSMFSFGGGEDDRNDGRREFRGRGRGRGRGRRGRGRFG